MLASQVNLPDQLRGLRRRWRLTIIAYSFVTGIVALILYRVWQPNSAVRWLVLASPIVLSALLMVGWRLADNRPDEESPLYASLGLANHLSILRGVLLAYLAGFIFSPRPTGWLAWSAGVLYTGAIVIDYADGIVARLTRHPSRLGAWLDTQLDALGILIAPVLGVWWGQLPPWYLLVAVAYYLFIGGKWFRTQRQLPLHALPPSIIRRPLAGIQMGFVSAVLWPVLTPPFTWWAATLVMIPFVMGFLRDWLVVSGQLDARSRGYRAASHYISILFRRWLPVGLRAGIAATFASLGWQFARTGSLAPYDTLTPLAICWIGVLMLLTIIGILGRLAATLLAIFVGLAMVRLGLYPAAWAVTGCSLALMLLGTGAWSIWQPEEIFLQNHYGGREA
jgi:CDP-diacylglycerol--glycerol-3-phosphate 3-phosphatidyltransferase